MDIFYVWLRRSLGDIHPFLFDGEYVNKSDEIVVDRPHRLSTSNKDVTFYEEHLAQAFADSRRVLRPKGICAIVFASKTTASWEALLEAVTQSGWTITASWPLVIRRWDTGSQHKAKHGLLRQSTLFAALVKTLTVHYAKKPVNGVTSCLNSPNESTNGCHG